MKAKIDIGARVKSNKAMTVKSEPLVVDLDVKPRVVVEAMASDLRQAIESQPSDRWDKTGTLKQGLRTTDSEVRAPDGRLERDELRVRFNDEVMPRDPFDSPAVTKAIDELLAKMLGGS